jgi:hypothetical protein
MKISIGPGAPRAGLARGDFGLNDFAFYFFSSTAVRWPLVTRPYAGNTKSRLCESSVYSAPLRYLLVFGRLTANGLRQTPHDGFDLPRY